MLPSPPVIRLTPPAVVEPPGRAGFPWIATVAPVVVSIVIWQVTGMILSLLFALLGPVVAVAGVVDGRIGRRRALRRAADARAAALDALRVRVDEAHLAEQHRVAGLVTDRRPWSTTAEGPACVAVGVGPLASTIELAGDRVDDDEPLARVRAAAAAGGIGVLVEDAAAGLGIAGPEVLAAAVARSVAVQLSTAWSPASVELAVPPDEQWAAQLPHVVRDGAAGEYRWRFGDGGEVVVAWAAAAADLPSDAAVTIDLRALGAGAAARPCAISRDEAQRAALDLTARAVDAGITAPGGGLVDRLGLADLDLGDLPAGVLGAVLGCDDRGPVVLDLATDGPHALVAGMTGAGKSELLITWVLAMAAGRSPDQVSFLLIDFKGGSAFTPLRDLPHVVGVLSDLEPALARRTVRTLRAELRRRERILADATARSIADLADGDLPRLVVVVDEYAALAATMPELHDEMADLAARGRSLGLHLVLCTQRPAGVVRDAVLANVGIRLALRVADRADSIAVIGDDAASRLAAEPRGRAIAIVDSRPRVIQVAMATAADISRITAASPSRTHPVPWCEPLPSDLPLDSLPQHDATSDVGGMAFGLVDLPDEQRQPVAAHDPVRHGHLLVVGAAASGVSTALATLAASAKQTGRRVVVLPTDPADAWQVLHSLALPSAVGVVSAADQPAVLIADDLDALLARFDDEHRFDAGELLATLLRGGGAACAVIAGVRRLGGPVASVGALFGARLVLRQASREDQVLVGGGYDDWDADAPPGRGLWRGAPVHVAWAGPTGASRPPTATVDVPSVRPGEHATLAVVATRVEAWAEQLRAAGVRVVPVGADPAVDGAAADDAPCVVLGDPDAWQADWALLVRARRSWPVVVTGCTAADVRMLSGSRAAPPPLGRDPRECWLMRDGVTVRARLELGVDAR